MFTALFCETLLYWVEHAFWQAVSVEAQLPMQLMKGTQPESLAQVVSDEQQCAVMHDAQAEVV
jgi:hypothetical protein